MSSPMEKLKNIAESLGCPYAIHEYIGESDKFCVYEISGFRGAAYADDRAQEHIARARLCYTQPSSQSYMDVLWKIIDAFIDAGFTEPDIEVNYGNHYTTLDFSAEIVVEREE